MSFNAEESMTNVTWEAFVGFQEARFNAIDHMFRDGGEACHA